MGGGQRERSVPWEASVLFTTDNRADNEFYDTIKALFNYGKSALAQSSVRDLFGLERENAEWLSFRFQASPSV